MGELIAHTMNPFVILSLEEEVFAFLKAKLQECDNSLHGHVGPLGECWVLV